MSVMLYPCIFCVSLSMDLFVACLALFLNCCGCGCYLVVECMVFVSVVGGALLDRPCMAPSICLCMSEVISSFNKSFES